MTLKNRKKFTYAEFTILTKMRKQFDILFPFSKMFKKFTIDNKVLLSNFNDLENQITKYLEKANLYISDLTKLVYFFDDQVYIK